MKCSQDFAALALERQKLSVPRRSTGDFNWKHHNAIIIISFEAFEVQNEDRVSGPSVEGTMSVET